MLDLQDDVFVKSSVERFEVIVSVAGTTADGTIDKSTPDAGAAVRSEGAGQCVCTVVVIASVVVRSGFSLRIRLNQKAAEVGDEPVNFHTLLRPPKLGAGIQRIGRLQAARAHRPGEVDRQPDLHTPVAENIGHRHHMVKHVGIQCAGVGVDVVEDDVVDADGCQRPGVVPNPCQVGCAMNKIKETPARIAALDGFAGPGERIVQVVPMVEHPPLKERGFGGVEPVEHLAEGEMTDQMLCCHRKRCPELRSVLCGHCEGRHRRRVATALR